jgi:osmoprotectant transport system substrate-binding protein
MRATHRTALALLVAVLAAVVAGGCGAGPTGSEGGSIAEDYSLSGPQDTAQFTVGSKDFTEQRVLGQIAVQALEAAGADVTDRTNLGDNEAVRQALISRDIDMYWEYTATAWLVHLAQPDPISDPQEQYERVAERDLERNNIEWLERAPGNNTYAIAVSESKGEDLGVETISELVDLLDERPEEATLCYGNEDDFSSRSDGLPGLEEAYEFEYPEDRQTVVPHDSVYENVRRGERCNFGVVFTTDGRIQEMNLQLLEDDNDFFAVYNPAMTVRAGVLESHPQLERLFASISETLDTETLRDLNSAVDVDGESPENVAGEWLRENGFVE